MEAIQFAKESIHKIAQIIAQSRVQLEGKSGPPKFQLETPHSQDVLLDVDAHLRNSNDLVVCCCIDSRMRACLLPLSSLFFIRVIVVCEVEHEI